MKAYSEIGKCSVCGKLFSNYRYYCDYQIVSGYEFYYCPDCECVPVDLMGNSCKRCGEFFWRISCYACKITKINYNLPTFS